MDEPTPNAAQKIMVVEDDKFLMKIYQSKLNKEGFEVVAAHDGEEATTLIPAEMPQLILLDLIMPKKTGFEVLTEIKQNPATAQIPVLILSNLGQSSDVEKGMQLGAVDYVVKSNMSITEIIEKVKGFLKNSPAQ